MYNVKVKILYMKNIKKFSSLFNGNIDLMQENGRNTLLVNGFVETGAEMEDIWSQAFEKLIPLGENVKSALMLGFAGGSIVKLLTKRWSDCKITAVEIDPVMMMIAKEHFPENLKGVDVVIRDAVEFIDSLPQKSSFDLIIADCFIGGNIEPESFRKIDFLLKLRKVAKRVLINQLLLPNNKNPMKKFEFLRDLNKFFPVEILRLPYNVMTGF
jgi:hypothetical protein